MTDSDWDGPERRSRRDWRDRVIARAMPAMLIIVAVVVVVGLGGVKASHDNCVRIHKLWAAGAQIIGTPDELKALHAAGRITQVQLDRLLGWYSADCAPGHVIDLPSFLT